MGRLSFAFQARHGNNKLKKGYRGVSFSGNCGAASVGGITR